MKIVLITHAMPGIRQLLHSCVINGWPSVIRNVSGKQTHGTFYTAPQHVRLFS